MFLQHIKFFIILQILQNLHLCQYLSIAITNSSSYQLFVSIIFSIC